MLAKELKIKTLKRQREFIKERLLEQSESQNGCTDYVYVGEVYSEVIQYFEREGFCVEEVDNDILMAETKGKSMYRFTIDKRQCSLNQEEKDKAEQYLAQSH